jgi:A/G-specific adenine glycosylase
MQKAAKVILATHQGRFPARYEDVLELPGIGRYTAGAICSIAFNQARPILDGNIVRVLTRVDGIGGDPRDRAVNASLWALSERLVREAQSHSGQPKAGGQIANRKSKIANHRACSHLNQSLMELGALVCTPRQPRCDACPVMKHCVARKRGLTALLPRLAPRPAVTKRRFVAFVIRENGKVLVRQRPAGVVNAHLWELPNVEVANDDDADARQACREALGVTAARAKELISIRHSITRYRIRLDVFQISPRGLGEVSVDHGQWFSRRDLERLPFASAHKKVLAIL